MLDDERRNLKGQYLIGMAGVVDLVDLFTEFRHATRNVTVCSSIPLGLNRRTSGRIDA